MVLVKYNFIAHDDKLSVFGFAIDPDVKPSFEEVVSKFFEFERFHKYIFYLI